MPVIASASMLHSTSPPTRNGLLEPRATTTPNMSENGDTFDEFEEFRARANSGGLSPQMRQLLRGAENKSASERNQTCRNQDAIRSSADDRKNDKEEDSDDSIDRYFPSPAAAQKYAAAAAAAKKLSGNTFHSEDTGDKLARQSEKGSEQHHHALPRPLLEWRRLRTEGPTLAADNDWHQLGDSIRPRTQSMPVRPSIMRPVTPGNLLAHRGGHRPATGSVASASAGTEASASASAMSGMPCSSSGYHLLRSFVISKKGLLKEDLVINCGAVDYSLRRESGYFSQSTNSYSEACSTALSTSSGHCSKTLSESLSHVSHKWLVEFRVVVLGASGIGKSALVKRFTRSPVSDYITLQGEEDGDPRITILLDGEKSTLEFIDKPDVMEETVAIDDDADAYVVVYSVEDRQSLDTATELLYELRKQLGHHAPVILVANKTDLVRTRIISEAEGKQMAANYDCKYIEVSAAIDHKVDDLLVGILKQIRLVKQRQQLQRNAASSFRRRAASTKVERDVTYHCCPFTGKHSVLRRLFGVYFTSKSCDNLYVL